MRRGASNLKIWAFTTLRPPGKASFVATRRLSSLAAATRQARPRCIFRRALPRYCSWFAGRALPAKCRTIFRVSAGTREYRDPLPDRDPQDVWRKKAGTNRTGKYADRRAPTDPNAGCFFDDRRETMHRMVAARNRAGRQRIHQDRDEHRYGASMAVEQTSTRPSRDKLAGNFCRGRRALRVGETLRRSSRRRRHGRRRCPNQVGFVILNPDPRRLRNASIKSSD
jgi:hypothetical protein